MTESCINYTVCFFTVPVGIEITIVLIVLKIVSYFSSQLKEKNALVFRYIVCYELILKNCLQKIET